MDPEYLSAADAADALGVNLKTLYVYVSRKGIRSQPIPGSRQKLYWKADIDRILHKEPKASAVAMRVRDESRITLITESEAFYRGQKVVELAESATFESVAALLWDVPESVAFEPVAPASTPLFGVIDQALAGEGYVNRAMALMSLLEEANPKAYDLSRPGMARTGADVLRWLAAILTYSDAPTAEPIPDFIGRQLKLADVEVDLVRRLLILSADHGFEPGTVAVRALAGCGVTPWRAVMGGLSVSVGRRTRVSNNDAISRFMSELIASPDPAKTVVRRIRDGEPLPGFESILYPHGDPRGRAIFDHARKVYEGDEMVTKLDAAFEVVRSIQDRGPNLALASLFVGRRIGLAPRHTLFNVGRAAGWIAHAIEQYQLGEWDHQLGSYRGPLPLKVMDDGALSLRTR